MTILRLVVDFDGLLNPMPKGWFDLGAHDDSNAKETIRFLTAATEYFDVYIFGPRSLMFGGIQSIQAAIISWVTMEVNRETMHDLMELLYFPQTEPTGDVCVNSSGVKWNVAQNDVDPELVQFVNLWQEALAAKAKSPKEVA